MGCRAVPVRGGRTGVAARSGRVASRRPAACASASATTYASVMRAKSAEDVRVVDAARSGWNSFARRRYAAFTSGTLGALGRSRSRHASAGRRGDDKASERAVSRTLRLAEPLQAAHRLADRGGERCGDGSAQQILQPLHPLLQGRHTLQRGPRALPRHRLRCERRCLSQVLQQDRGLRPPALRRPLLHRHE